MGALLAAIRSDVRKDLKDDPADRWTDAVLDRHIGRTVAEYSRHRPRERKSTVATTNGSKLIDITGLPVGDVVEVLAVEFPIDENPRKFISFDRFAGDLEMVNTNDQGDGTNCRIYWGSLHTLDAVTSTISPEDDEIIKTGAAAYALQEYAQYTVDRINVGGDEADAEYRRLAEIFWKRYVDQLAELRRSRPLRTSRLYAPTEAAFRRNVVQGP